MPPAWKARNHTAMNDDDGSTNKVGACCPGAILLVTMMTKVKNCCPMLLHKAKAANLLINACDKMMTPMLFSRRNHTTQ